MDALRGYVSGNASRERRSRAAIDALAKVAPQKKPDKQNEPLKRIHSKLL